MSPLALVLAFSAALCAQVQTPIAEDVPVSPVLVSPLPTPAPMGLEEASPLVSRPVLGALRPLLLAPNAARSLASRSWNAPRTAHRKIGDPMARPTAGVLPLLHRAARLLTGAGAKLELQGRFWDGRGKLLNVGAGLNAVGRGRLNPDPGPFDDGMSVDEPPEPETVTREIAEAKPETLDVRFSNEAKNKLKRSELYATVRLLGGSGSRWHWGRFAGDVPIRVLVGGKTFFHSRVTEGGTKAIDELTKADLQGVYPKRVLKNRTIAQLRRKLIEDLTQFSRYTPNRRGRAAVVTPKSQVRVVRFLPYRDARHLDENMPEDVYEPRARAPIEVPPALTVLHAQPPKAVFIDMRGIEGPLGADLWEDMGKLQKDGLYFILLTDKPLAGPGSLEEQLTAGLTNRQREELVRYKLFAVTENGNRMHEYFGAFPQPLRLREFTPFDLEMMDWAARTLPPAKVVERRPSSFVATLNLRTDAEGFAQSLSQSLARYGLPSERYVLQTGLRGGRPSVSLRPNDLPRSMPQVLEALQDNQGLDVLNSDLLVISEDPVLLKAFPGAAFLQDHAPNVHGRGLLELGLAAMLGDYRENMPEDQAASASKLAQFLKDPDQIGGEHYNIFMLTGHVIHSTFGWGIWIYRRTGVLPSAEELTARALKTWRHEDMERTKNLLDAPGDSMADSQATMERRLKNMYPDVANALKEFPIVIGTELPILFRYNRYKKGQFQHRDFFRLIFDLVLARETKDGLEYLIVDFKTGQTYVLPAMVKDIQVQLYDAVSPKKWPQLNLPYGLTGKPYAASPAGIRFLFPSGPYQPALDDFDRMKFDQKWLPSKMNLMRRHNAKISAPAPEDRRAAKPGKSRK